MIGRIHGRAVFQRIRSEGKHLRAGVLSCTMILDASLDGPRVGYSIGRSFGSAVHRNRLRRQLRALVNSRFSTLAPGFYVLGASPRAKGATSAELDRSLEKLAAKVLESQRGAA